MLPYKALRSCLTLLALSSCSTPPAPGESVCGEGITLSNGEVCTGPSPGRVDCKSGGNAACGAHGLCANVSEEATLCCGATNACCSVDTDCCSSGYGNFSDGGVLGCIAGVCSSFRNPCVCDADCTGGAVCFQVPSSSASNVSGTCLKPPGAACFQLAECSAGPGAFGEGCGGTCPLGTASPSSPPCRTSADCANGTCQGFECQRVDEGAPCTTDADCRNGACTGGSCHCLPAGSTPLTDVENPGCCSRGVFMTFCSAQKGSSCTVTTTPDCFGGTCAGGVCACVGRMGLCEADSDCCAGATACISGFCQ
jgi:hypothetical protein